MPSPGKHQRMRNVPGLEKGIWQNLTKQIVFVLAVIDLVF